MNRDEIKSLLLKYSYSDYKSLFDKYSAWLVKDKVEKSVIFPNSIHEIAVFQFRCNESISFNNEIRNNDLLVLMRIADNTFSINDFFFDVTCDPKSRVHGIAHVCAQIYRGNVGPHRGDPSRPCIRSDFGFGTWYNRTDNQGDVIDLNPSPDYTSVTGHIGINIHNAGGFYNSSLGCTIFNSESEYRNLFVPLIADCTNKNNIPVSVIDAADLKDILGMEATDENQ